MPKDISRKILDATMEVIAREKISGTRMHLIAKEAGMTQSNLHYYFPTKNDLLIAILDEIQNCFSRIRMGTINVENKSFNENLHGLFEEKKDVILNNKKLDYLQFDYWVQGTVNPEVQASFQKNFDIWRNNIKEVLSKNPYSSGKDLKHSDMLPFIMVSLMIGASMQYLIDEGKFDLDEYFIAAEKLVLNLLGDSKKEE